MKTTNNPLPIIVFVFIFFSVFYAKAEKIEVDGIYYTLENDGTATVTYRGEEEDGWMYFTADELYMGDVEIPAEIKYADNVYQVNAIGNDAFAGSKFLSSLSIPHTLSTIGSGVFSLCNGLKSIQVDDQNPTFISYDGILYKRNPLTIFFVPKNISGDISLLDSIHEIPSGAFQNCSNLTTLSLPNEVVTISDGAFNGCENLQEIFIGDKLESIGEYAFSKCLNLSILSLPESVKTIKAAAFADCENLVYVLLHEGLESIGKMAFYNCPGLMGIQLPSTLTTIGEQAFKECVSLDIVKNDSKLPIEIGSTDYGYVAYYASQIINDSESSLQENINYNRISVFKEDKHWLITNAKGKWICIYTIKGEYLGCHFCRNEIEEIEVRASRIVVVEK